MRILAIRGKNLASLAEPFEILLNEGPLQQAGLFAITGPTGAGKSTILDALCLALYDKMPRLPDGHGFAVGHKDEDENLRVTSNDVRSILRRGTSHAYAEVDFTGKDKHHYRARWEVSKARGKASGRLQAQDIILSNIASGQRIGQGKRNTLEIISELIDLNFDQFRRSVLLAQGDFAAFLKAKKDERSSLLERITGTDIYSELSIAAFERARQEKEALNRIAGLMQNQIPLDSEARLNLEQQRDQFSRQLAELDQQISDNQKIIDWYVELKKRRQAQQQAIEAHAKNQQIWEASEPERLLIQKVEAVQPLRPLLSHYKTANDDYQDAEKILKTSGEMQIAADSSLQAAKEQLAVQFDQLHAAEQQQQQAQPLLKAARDLDTRLDVIQIAVNALTAEENLLYKALETAQQRHESLLKQQGEKASTLAQLTLWLDQHQAIKPIAAEWNRWEGELERCQTLKAQQTAQSLQSEQIKLALNNDELVLAGLKTAIDENHKQLEPQQAKLEQLKEQGSQQPLETLYHEKDAHEHSVNSMTRALSLANQALELQQVIKQDMDKLASTGQLINEATQQLQTVTRQQTINDIALDEAKKALDLFQAVTHKNAEQFRRLLIEDQPCPVCGALEHPWKDHGSSSQGMSTLFTEQATAQFSIVDLSSAKPSPTGQIRRERIWSREERPQGSGQDSPETLGWVRGNQNKEKSPFISPHPILLPEGEGVRVLNSTALTAQMGRVNELQNRKETLIKNSAELNKTIVHALETQHAYAASLPLAQAKLESLGNEWSALALHDILKTGMDGSFCPPLPSGEAYPEHCRRGWGEGFQQSANRDRPQYKPDITLPDSQLLPLLNTRNEQLVSALELVKSREKTALELQKQMKNAQERFDATKQKTEKFSNEYTELDKQLAKNKADLEHISANVQQLEKQLQAIVDLLQTPFQHLENWQVYLQDSFAELKEKVQKFQQTGQVLSSATTSLVEINHDEKLAFQTLEQSLQHYRDKQAETRRKTEEKQILSTERDALLPSTGSGTRLAADSYEQIINQTVHTARIAHQQASNAVTQLEKELASLQQQQQHWQIETSRRQSNLEKALTTLNQALEKNAINLEQLSELLKQDEAWLSEQKTRMLALERALQESTALIKVKTEECRQHESHAVEITEEAANQTASELQLHKQNLNSQKEEQVLLLREDDKKIIASSHLKAELETQQNRWQQWESLNELIGSSNGAKFRVFAQSLTLEALLAHSNQHLEDFAKRYHLQRVPGSDLELQIIDRDMADDVRSVHSLSGGESFLVSLALALGLASLSSNKTQVESLFIDEGFGSLDPETLDIAIASLDTLQALGRKVGIISHVPILVERIGAKVVVEKQGGGRSSIVIVGGY